MKTTEFRSHGFFARVLGPLVLLGTFAGFLGPMKMKVVNTLKK